MNDTLGRSEKDCKNKEYSLKKERRLPGAPAGALREKPSFIIAQCKSIWQAEGAGAAVYTDYEEMLATENYFEKEGGAPSGEACAEKTGGAPAEETGGALRVAVDFHGRVHKTMARLLMKKLEPYDLLFVEEPVLAENEEALAELARSSNIPIATGERNYTRWGFKSLLASGAVDILQPDVSHAGGIWETRKIAAMAEAFDVALAPHCPLGPIALASCLQVDFCTPNAFLQEQSAGIHYNTGYDLLDYLKNPEVFRYEGGNAFPSKLPGLGVVIDEARVRHLAAQGHDWHNPIWRDGDGCIAEW